MFIQQGCSELNCWSGLGSATQFVCLGTEQLIPTYLPPKVKEEGLQMESLSWSTMDFYSSQWGQNNQTSQTDPFLLIGFVHITHSTRTVSHDYNSHWNAPRTLFSLQPPSTFCSTLLLGCINCREAWRGVTGNQSCPGVYLGAAESWAPGPALATWFVSRAQPNQRTVLLLRSVHWGFQLESLVSGTMTCDLRETLRCLRLSLEPFPRCAIAFLLVEYPPFPTFANVASPSRVFILCNLGPPFVADVSLNFTRKTLEIPAEKWVQMEDLDTIWNPRTKWMASPWENQL